MIEPLIEYNVFNVLPISWVTHHTYNRGFLTRLLCGKISRQKLPSNSYAHAKQRYRQY